MSEEKIIYPDILFRIAGGLYSIGSRYVISISVLPKYVPVPGAEKGVSGIIKFRDEILPVIDLRTVFEFTSLNQEYEEFANMMEARKQDHIYWVDELERSIQTGEKFNLATDPHKCAFGKWYDGFQTDSQTLAYHLKKIEEPHRKLHEAAEEVACCMKEQNEETRIRTVNQVLDQVKQGYMPQVVECLDEAKVLFQSSFSEMVIIIKNEHSQLGLIVDEVLTIEELEVVGASSDSLSFEHSRYTATAKQREGSGELILEVDDNELFTRFGNISVDAEARAAILQ